MLMINGKWGLQSISMLVLRVILAGAVGWSGVESGSKEQRSCFNGYLYRETVWIGGQVDSSSKLAPDPWSCPLPIWNCILICPLIPVSCNKYSLKSHPCLSHSSPPPLSLLPPSTSSHLVTFANITFSTWWKPLCWLNTLAFIPLSHSTIVSWPFSGRCCCLLSLVSFNKTLITVR